MSSAKVSFFYFEKNFFSGFFCVRENERGRKALKTILGFSGLSAKGEKVF